MASGKKVKKSKGKTLNLNDFLGADTAPAVPGQAVVMAPLKTTSWADEVENDNDQMYESRKERVVLPTAPRAARGTDVDEDRIPHHPPFLAYMSNLPYDLEEDDLHLFFNKLSIVKVRLPKDDRNDSGRLKGFGYVEFEERNDLKEAIGMSDMMLKNRRVRIEVSDNNDRRGGMGRDRDNSDRPMTDWRSGPREGPSDDRGDRGEGGFGGRREYGGFSRDRGEGGGGMANFSRDRGGDRDGGDRGGFSRDREGGGGMANFSRDRGGDREGGGGGMANFSRDRGGDREGGNFSNFSRGDRDGGSRYGGDRGGDRGGYGGDRDRGYGGDRNRGGYGGDRDRGYGGDRDRGYGGGGGDRDRNFGGDRYESRGGSDRYGDRRGGGGSEGGYQRRNYDNQEGGGGGRYPPRDEGREDRGGEEGPKERPKLQLAPRSKPAEVGDAAPAAAQSSIFGGARPVDTLSKELEIEQRLEKERAPPARQVRGEGGEGDGERPAAAPAPEARPSWRTERQAPRTSSQEDHREGEGESRAERSSEQRYAPPRGNYRQLGDLSPRGRRDAGPPRNSHQGRGEPRSEDRPSRATRDDRPSKPPQDRSRRDRDLSDEAMRMPKMEEQRAPDFAGSNIYAALPDEVDPDVEAD